MVPIRVILATGMLLGVVLVAPASADATAKPVVVAGVSQWATLARQVAGPDASVVSLLSDPNADPHQHEATTSDAAHVAQAAIVVENGAGYDTWLSKLVAARSHRPVVINVAKLVHVATGANPHLFYSVSTAETFVQALVRTLDQRGISGGVATRSTKILGRLAATAKSVQALRAACRGVKVAATEDVTGYLLAEIGLKVVTPESFRLAIGNGVDPSVQDLAQAISQLQHHPAFLVDNVQTRTPLTQELVTQARSSHVAVISVTETMSGSDYVAWINAVIAKMRVALHHQGCAP
jgi:zinc/manganese transport system substrate-binding protein